MQGERERPTRVRDSIGGDYSLSLLAALRFNLPGEISHAAGLRGQLYFNAGNNCSSLAGGNLSSKLSEFAKTMRFSIVSCIDLKVLWNSFMSIYSGLFVFWFVLFIFYLRFAV